MYKSHKTCFEKNQEAEGYLLGSIVWVAQAKILPLAMSLWSHFQTVGYEQFEL